MQHLKMAKLNSIYICGIRNYGIKEEDAQILKFDTPVTLFLGENGCGKTTILECVKHALTGDFPFSGKSGGQTFVTDPTLYGLSSVKGCIKLKLIDIYGNPATISRTLKLEIKHDKMRFSTEDASYCYIDSSGERRSLSVKLADCKDMIINLVGVSEAILNNVFLCHQEDSLWPLSEDSNVKKKFDQIFDSSKYEEALDALAKLIREHTDMHRSLSKELVYLQESKENSQLKNTILIEKKSALKLLNNEAQDLLNRKASLTEKLDGVIAMEESYCQLHKMKSNTENELMSNRNLQASINDLIQFPFEGSDAALEQEISNFHEQFLGKQKMLDQTEGRIIELKNKSRQVNSQQQDKKGKLAGLQEQINAYKHKLKDREDQVKTLLARYTCTFAENYGDNYDTLKIEMARERNAVTMKETQASLAEAQVQKEIDVCQEAHIAIKSREALKFQEHQAATDAKRGYESELEDHADSDFEFKNYESKISDAQKDIDQVLASFNEDNANKTLERNLKRIREVRETLEELDQELKTALKNRFTDEKITSYRSEKASKEKEIRNMKNKHHREFKLLFHDNIPDKNIHAEVAKIQIKHSQALQKFKKELTENERQVSKYNTQLSVTKIELSKMKDEHADGKLKIEQLCGNLDFKTKRTQVSENNCTLQKEKGQLSALRIIFKEFIKEISDKKCCPVCETDFSKKLETVEKVASQMKDRIRSIPDRLKTINLELETGEKLHSNLTELNPIYLKMTALQNNIVSKQKEVEIIEGKHSRVLQELQTLKVGIESNQRMYETAVRIVSSAALIDQHSQDVALLETKINDLQTKIITVESNRSATETEAMIEEFKEEITRLSDENDRLTKKSSACQARLHELRTKKSNLIDAQLKLQQSVQAKPQLLERLEEVEQKLAELEEVMSDVQNESLCALTALEEAKHKLDTVKKAHVAKLGEMRMQLQNNDSTFKDIQKLNNEIQQIEKKNLHANCETITTELNKLQSDLENYEIQATELNTQRDNLKDQLRDQDATDKSLQNTKKLRALKVLEVKLVARVNALALDLDGKNYNSIAEERNKLQKEIGEIDSTLSNIDGQVKSLQANINDIAKELANYKVDPIIAYQEKLCEIKFELLAIEDLRAMCDAMNTALCQFHCEQLAAINVRLKEHWEAVYKGKDIEYIQIHSGETEGMKQRRQYSYCVMQRKGDMFTPMRGKCSAGQKVLACVLVRIALAEHFSSLCGIFALDEPTTNLDRNNIKSLSSSIARLLTSEQSEFQFLIITHDEEFLDSLRQVGALDGFYRIQRNTLGRSFATKQRI